MDEDFSTLDVGAFIERVDTNVDALTVQIRDVVAAHALEIPDNRTLETMLTGIAKVIIDSTGDPREVVVLVRSPRCPPMNAQL
jgi:hypothetical protein